jgi:hypothetical protein
VIFEAPAPERGEEGEGEEKSEWFNILVLHQATSLSIDINLLSGIAIAVMG